MAGQIDENRWRQALRRPNWYLLLGDEFKALEKYAETLPESEHRQLKDQAYGLVEAALTSGELPLASNGDDLDRERQPVDTIVIHHTKNRPDLTLKRLNAIQLLRIYGRYYASPTDPRERHFKGQPVWSGHFYKGQQVFWGYHWLVRRDGGLEQLLKDDQIGWQAGNWEVNKQSVGICFDDDLTDKCPTDAALTAVAQLIQEKYSNVAAARVVGHHDVNQQTVCPGQRFATEWRARLLQRPNR